jgi:hypothetical protein
MCGPRTCNVRAQGRATLLGGHFGIGVTESIGSARGKRKVTIEAGVGDRESSSCFACPRSRTRYESARGVSRAASQDEFLSLGWESGRAEEWRSRGAEEQMRLCIRYAWRCEGKMSRKPRARETFESRFPRENYNRIIGLYLSHPRLFRDLHSLKVTTSIILDIGRDFLANPAEFADALRSIRCGSQNNLAHSKRPPALCPRRRRRRRRWRQR